LSKTARGGQIIDSNTRQILINLFFDFDVIIGHYLLKKVTITSLIFQTFMTSIHKGLYFKLKLLATLSFFFERIHCFIEIM
jgi:hypothetical protein